MAMIITAPADAACALYTGVPEKRDYASCVIPENVVPATEVITEGNSTTYFPFE